MSDYMHMLLLLGVASARPAGAMLFLPVFSSMVLGGGIIRNALLFMFAVLSVPVLLGQTIPDPEVETPAFIWLLCCELISGMMMGFSASIPFWSMDMAGHLLDTMRGSSMGGILNPLSGEQSSPLGILFTQLLIILFFITNGFQIYLACFFSSYTLLPPGEEWTLTKNLIPLMKNQWVMMYEFMLTFAMPGVVIMVLTDLALGLINSTAQQINVFMLSMPIKSVLILLITIIALPFGLLKFIYYFEHFDGGLFRALIVMPHE